MAGDWIPHEKGLAKKPEVLAIAKATGKHRKWVAETLEEFWEWVDQVSPDGCLGVSLGDLVGLVSETDLVFWEAVVSVGWLRVSTNGLTIPNFDRWFGANAKKRLAEARRKRLQRERSPPDTSCPVFVPEITDKKRTKNGRSVLSYPVAFGEKEIPKQEEDGVSVDSLRAKNFFLNELSPEALAQRWCFHCARRRFGACSDNEFDVAVQFRAWIEGGLDPKVIAEAIDAPRDRTEHLWQFKEKVMPWQRPAAKKKEVTADDIRKRLEQQEAERNGRKLVS